MFTDPGRSIYEIYDIIERKDTLSGFGPDPPNERDKMQHLNQLNYTQNILKTPQKTPLQAPERITMRLRKYIDIG